jgi:hypothetical protein
MGGGVIDRGEGTRKVIKIKIKDKNKVKKGEQHLGFQRGPPP